MSYSENSQTFGYRDNDADENPLHIIPVDDVEEDAIAAVPLDGDDAEPDDDGEISIVGVSDYDDGTFSLAALDFDDDAVVMIDLENDTVYDYSAVGADNPNDAAVDDDIITEPAAAEMFDADDITAVPGSHDFGQDIDFDIDSL